MVQFKVNELCAFERYNGILGAMPNNNRFIEIQLMTRFLPLFPTPMQTSGSVADTLS